MKLDIIKFDRKELIIKVRRAMVKNKVTSHSSRLVFVFNDFVVKFDTGTQNSSEKKFYQELLDKKDAQYFPKLLGYGEFDGRTYLIQERVKGRSVKITKEHADTLNYLQRKYKLWDLSPADVGDYTYKRDNFLVTSKGLKIYDVGYYGPII